MYVALGVLVTLVFWATALLGQQMTKKSDKGHDALEKRLRLREEMHRRMMDKLLRGIGPDQDMFSDMEKLMDEVMNDSLSDFGSFPHQASEGFDSDWSESPSGRTLSITPKNKDQKLNIDVSNGMVVIKGTSEIKTSQGSSVSNFVNSFSVPEDCDPGQVKIEDKQGKILVFFPYRGPTKEIRKPLPPTREEVQI
jgi:HSP20 family molecular chaperone IbpA